MRSVWHLKINKTAILDGILLKLMPLRYGSKALTVQGLLLRTLTQVLNILTLHSPINGADAMLLEILLIQN
ncbi:hypothetical protein D3C77_416380 [compost metagenome]